MFRISGHSSLEGTRKESNWLKETVNEQPGNSGRIFKGTEGRILNGTREQFIWNLRMILAETEGRILKLSGKILKSLHFPKSSL